MYKNRAEENQRITRLAQLFIDNTDSGLPCNLDKPDLEDVIDYLIGINDKKNSKLAIEQGIKTYPEESFFRILLAKFFILNNRFQDAEKELRYVETHFPPSPELYFEQVVLAHSGGYFPVNAISLLKKSLALDYSFPETHLLCAVEYLHLHKLNLAIRHAKIALHLNPEIDEDLRLLVIGFNGLQDNLPSVIRFFALLVDEFPLSTSLWNGLGLCYEFNDEHLNAIEAFQYQSSLDPQDDSIYYYIGKCYLELTDYESALLNFNKANAVGNKHEYDVLIGHCYFMMNQFDKAITYLLKSTADSVHYHTAIADIVEIFKKQHNLSGAREFLLKNLNNTPQDFDSLEELLKILDPDKDFDEMCHYCFQTIESDHDISDFFQFFIPFCCENEFYELGLSVCQKYVDDTRIANSIGYYLATLNILNGNIDDGCNYLKNAILISPDNCLDDFIFSDDRLEDFPQVQTIIEANSDIIRYNFDIGSEPDTDPDYE